MYPLNRNRRLRSKESLRNLVRESAIHPHDFIAPLFVIEGSNIKEEISYKDGLRHGPFKVWHENGNLEGKGQFHSVLHNKFVFTHVSLLLQIRN